MFWQLISHLVQCVDRDFAEPSCQFSTWFNRSTSATLWRYTIYFKAHTWNRLRFLDPDYIRWPALIRVLVSVLFKLLFCSLHAISLLRTSTSDVDLQQLHLSTLKPFEILIFCGHSGTTHHAQVLLKCSFLVLCLLNSSLYKDNLLDCRWAHQQPESLLQLWWQTAIDLASINHFHINFATFINTLHIASFSSKFLSEITSHVCYSAHVLF